MVVAPAWSARSKSSSAKKPLTRGPRAGAVSRVQIQAIMEGEGERGGGESGWCVSKNSNRDQTNTQQTRNGKQASHASTKHKHILRLSENSLGKPARILTSVKNRINSEKF